MTNHVLELEKMSSGGGKEQFAKIYRELRDINESLIRQK
jgi:hypothetical protein